MSKKRMIGGKANGLIYLQKLKLNVPKFLVFTAKEIAQMQTTEIFKQLDVKYYAVRSSSETEDQEEKAEAGQFKTVTKVTKDGLEKAIQDVLTHAKNYLKGDLRTFAVIIQEYIEADISGVLFTRDPQGNRFYVLEHHKGSGEALVSGKITPKTFYAYWNEKKSPLLPSWETFKNTCYKIEQKHNHPQDIEWCIKDGTWYFLQSRPITTITPEDFQKIVHLEKQLPQTGDYRFIQNDVTDSFGAPSPFTLKLASQLYKKGGPIDAVYRKYRINYNDTKMFTVFGNKFYIDAEKELQSLLPSFSLLNKKRQPKWTYARKSLITLKNIVMLSAIPMDTTHLQNDLKKLLITKIKVGSVDEWIMEFKKIYEVIFEINLRVAIQSKRSNTEIQKIQINLPEESKDWIGNSLSISDLTAFHSAKTNKVEIREAARWLTVKYMNALRPLLTKTDITVSKQEYIPNYETIDSTYVETPANSVGISKGEAEGIVITKAQLETSKKQSILFIEMLTPDLAQHLNKISGIISRRGGVLSHMAIIAREAGIPVVINNKIGNIIGTTVKIDGSTGEIEITQQNQ